MLVAATNSGNPIADLGGLGPNQSGKAAAPVFVLVHGTWARNAPWVRPDSNVVSTLAKEFPGATIVPLKWSGANTFSARSAAADGLVHTVSEFAGQRRPIILIGHSHGGSAIVYALRRSERLRVAIVGAVLMGTPFYALAPRSGHKEMFTAIAVLLFTLFSLVVSFLVGYVVDLPAWSQATQDAELLAIAAAAFLALVAVGRRATGRTAWLERLVERLSHAGSQWNTVDCPSVPLLFVRTTGDEVALALAGLQLLAYASNTASRGFAAVMRRLAVAGAAAWSAMWSRVLAVGLGSAVVSAVFMCGFLMGQNEFPLVTVLEVANPLNTRWLLLVTGVRGVDQGLTLAFRVAIALDWLTLTSVCLVGGALCVGLVVAGILSTATLFAFGVFSPKQALALEMAAEPIPYGIHEFVHIAWNSGTASGPAGFSLRHSAPYEDPNGVRELVKWTRRRLSGRAGPDVQ